MPEKKLINIINKPLIKMGIYPNSGKHSAKIIIQTPKFLYHQIKVFGCLKFLKTHNMFFAFKNRLPTHLELV